ASLFIFPLKNTNSLKEIELPNYCAATCNQTSMQDLVRTTKLHKNGVNLNVEQDLSAKTRYPDNDVFVSVAGPQYLHTNDCHIIIQKKPMMEVTLNFLLVKRKKFYQCIINKLLSSLNFLLFFFHGIFVINGQASDCL
ncbi:hypothetical protein ACJX0J_036570, partial [Zea mays]